MCLSEKCRGSMYTKLLTIALFICSAGHPMLDLAIEHFDVVFDGSWGSAGPELLTRVLRTLCEFGPNEKFFDASVHTKERCQGVEVL